MATKDVLTSLAQLKPLPATYREIIETLLKKENPRIGELEYDKAIGAIAEVFGLVCEVQGFRTSDLGDKANGKILGFIYFNFKQLHPIEIEIAFDLLAKGAIKVDSTKGYNLRYLAQVLNAYVELRKNIDNPRIAHQRAKKDEEEKKDEQSTMKPEDFRKMHIDTAKSIQMFYDKYLIDAQTPYSDYMSSFTYGYLVKRGFISKATFENSETHKKAIELLSTRRSRSGISLSYDANDITSTKMDIIVAEVFKRWKELEVKPYELLTKELK